MDVRFADGVNRGVMLNAVRMDRAFGKTCALRLQTRMAALFAVETAAELFPLPGRWRPFRGTQDHHLVADLDSARELIVAADTTVAPPALDQWSSTTGVTVLGVFDRTPNEGTATSA
jgi:hypothetical protein